MSGGNNNEGEDHQPITSPPAGSTFTKFPVSNGAQIAAYWTAQPKNAQATQSFIMIHGRLRDGDNYWNVMNQILQDAISTKTQGVDPNAIIVAPEFFSAKYNSGQYDSDTLAWGDVNAWQAGDPAVSPASAANKVNSFDALDALVNNFLNRTAYPAMQRITVVGHGGGGQLNQRYAAVGTPQHNPNVHIRYIHGDPSSCAYFTTDRPSSVDGQTLPQKSACPMYNTWRYGFDNFTGNTLQPQDYFRQYISRDVVSMVGYDDTDPSGDNYCMAQIQGGLKRRDRNLVWWRYINTLYNTGEDLTGFPGTFDTLPNWSNTTSGNAFGVKLIVVQGASHDPRQVFDTNEGRAALFQVDSTKLPFGWRPAGWQNTSRAQSPNYELVAASSSSGSNSNGGSKQGTNHSSAASPLLRGPHTMLLLITAILLVSSCILHVIV